MSDIDGEDAFDKVMDRLCDAYHRAEQKQKELWIAESENCTLKDHVKKLDESLSHWRHEVGKKESQIARMLALLPPEHAALFNSPPVPTEQVNSTKDDLPF